MELNKRKFKKDEVELIINKINSAYNERLAESFATINELKAENKKLSYELKTYQDQEDSIGISVKESVERAKEKDLLIEKKYNAEIVALKEFHENWSEYFEYIFEKYPLYPEIEKLKEITKNISKILLSEDNAHNKVNKISGSLEKNNSKVFDPKKKIQDYVVATSDNGFNLDDVLNPGELKLEDICKELGLIE